jgi:hypothetical protein
VAPIFAVTVPAHAGSGGAASDERTGTKDG